MLGVRIVLQTVLVLVVAGGIEDALTLFQIIK